MRMGKSGSFVPSEGMHGGEPRQIVWRQLCQTFADMLGMWDIIGRGSQ